MAYKRKVDTTFMSPVEVYNVVLSGELKRFPDRYWEKPESLQYAYEILKFLFEEVLNFNMDDIKQTVTVDIFRQHRLSGMLEVVFNKNPYAAVNHVYPGVLKPWELLHTPHNFWNKETAKDATLWLIEDRLKWTAENVKENLTKKHLRQTI